MGVFVILHASKKVTSFVVTNFATTMSRPLPLQQNHVAGSAPSTPTTTATRSSPLSRQHRKSLSGGSSTSHHHHHAPAVSSPTPSCSNGTTIRRLSDDDVRTIFECLHHRTPLPARLAFVIVSVGANGLKLSPPSYEFEGKFIIDCLCVFFDLCEV